MSGVSTIKIYSYITSICSIPYLEHVSRVPVLSSSAFSILFLVKYLCVGRILLRLFVGLWYFKVVLLCVIVCGICICILCSFDVECFEYCVMFCIDLSNCGSNRKPQLSTNNTYVLHQLHTSQERCAQLNIWSLKYLRNVWLQKWHTITMRGFLEPDQATKLKLYRPWPAYQRITNMKIITGKTGREQIDTKEEIITME